MKLFVQPTPAPEAPRYVKAGALIYAVIIVVILVAQLFTFDTFIELMDSFDFPGGRTVAYFVAASLVSIELLSLPFLLRMSLSPAFRVLSALCGWLVGVYWLCISMWAITTVPEATNIGLFGTVINSAPGTWILCASVLFIILAGLASRMLMKRPAQHHTS